MKKTTKKISKEPVKIKELQSQFEDMRRNRDYYKEEYFKLQVRLETIDEEQKRYRYSDSAIIGQLQDQNGWLRETLRLVIVPLEKESRLADLIAANEIERRGI